MDLIYVDKGIAKITFFSPPDFTTYFSGVIAPIHPSCYLSASTLILCTGPDPDLSARMSACCRATGRRSTSNPGLRGNHSITLNSFLCHLKKCHVPELTPACLLSVTSTGQFSWFALALLPGSSPVTAALPALYAAAAAMLLELQLKQSKSWECRSGEPTFLQHFQI